jgi:hypothetical protein
MIQKKIVSSGTLRIARAAGNLANMGESVTVGAVRSGSKPLGPLLTLPGPVLRKRRL